MDYVKGCDVTSLSNFRLKRIASGKLKIVDGLKDVLSYEILSDMLAEAKKDFVTGAGKTVKGLPSSEIFLLTKKIDRQNYIIGLSEMKRIAGEPTGTKGLEAFFEASPDTVVEKKRMIAGGFDKEAEYLDHIIIEHYRNEVGSGQFAQAEYQDMVITRVKTKKILGITISQTAFFILMLAFWGLVFKNFALGLCFAICFVGSFTIITNKSKSVKTDNKQEN